MPEANPKGAEHGSDEVTIPDPELARIAQLFDGQDLQSYEGLVDFFLESGINVVANRRSAGDKVRMRFYLPAFEDDFEDDAADWVDEQAEIDGAALELDEQHGFWTPRLVIERAIGNNWIADPVHEQLATLLASWRAWVPQARSSHMTNVIKLDYDPIDIEPASAWLFFSSEQSIPTPAELRDSRRRNANGEFDFYWTSSKHVEPGDLVLIYVIRPFSAVTHVARAANRARIDDAFQAIDGPQRRARKEPWVHLTAPIAIQPIPFADLQAASQDHLLLRGNARYLRPEWIENLTVTAPEDEDREILARVVRTPVGRADLPEPRGTTFQQWREIAAGALLNEALVERHVVEPLLRLVGVDEDFLPQYRVGQRRADYVVLTEGAPSCVIEVKLAIRDAVGGAWIESPDFQQTQWYAEQLEVNSILIDAHRICLIDQGGSEPKHSFLRRDAGESDLELVKHHLGRP